VIPIPEPAGWLIECMGIAEDVLAATPELSFPACTPTAPLLAIASTPLYLAHLLELAERAKSGTALGPGTAAEIAAVMSMTSLKAPLTRQAAAVYAWAMRDAWSRGELASRAMPVDLDEIVRGEAYDGAIAEDVAAIRRRLTADR
jgi:hypothetical protein